MVNFGFTFALLAQFTLNNCLNKIFQCLDSNHGHLALEATALSNVLLPLPVLLIILTSCFLIYSHSGSSLFHFAAWFGC